MLQASETTKPDKNIINCYNLKITGKINTYKCDMDQDGMPDVCDSDIDGDGVKNPISILLTENDDCSYTSDIINRPLI